MNAVWVRAEGRGKPRAWFKATMPSVSTPSLHVNAHPHQDAFRSCSSSVFFEMFFCIHTQVILSRVNTLFACTFCWRFNTLWLIKGCQCDRSHQSEKNKASCSFSFLFFLTCYVKNCSFNEIGTFVHVPGTDKFIVNNLELLKHKKIEASTVSLSFIEHDVPSQDECGTAFFFGVWTQRDVR